MHIKGENIQENLERWITWLLLESDGLGEGGAVFLMTRLMKIFLFLVANFCLDDGWFLLFRDFSCSGIDFMNNGSLL